jgi:hypothetical protein
MSIKINLPNDIVTRKITLTGMTDIMFDRYAGDNNTKLEPNQKLYVSPIDSATIGIPAVNIMSLLSAHNTNSAPKRLRDKRKYKDIANACLSYVSISPTFIPLMRDGKPIKFGSFDSKTETDSLSGCYIHRSVARLDKGIPNPKVRPVIPVPWSLTFQIQIFPNKEIKEQEILNLISEAGIAIGLGTFRGVFGKYSVTGWDDV